MQVPTVTTDDLVAFQTRTFGTSAQQTSLPHHEDSHETSNIAQWSGFEQDSGFTAHIDKEEDDGLGYYPDGVKRTLTDEQVAMFRHSEVYAILRARQVAKENEDVEDGEVEYTRVEIDAQVEGRGEKDDTSKDARGGIPASDLDAHRPFEQKSINHPEDDPSNPISTMANQEQSRTEHATSTELEKPSLETPIQAPKQQQQQQYAPRNEKRKRKRYETEQHAENLVNSKIRLRGRVRELDASFAAEHVLDYGDEEAPAEAAAASEPEDDVKEEVEDEGGVQHQPSAEEYPRPNPEGRKIWWPVLGSE